MSSRSPTPVFAMLAGLAALGCRSETPSPERPPAQRPPVSATATATQAPAPASAPAAALPAVPADATGFRYRARALVEANRFDDAAAAFEALLRSPAAQPVDAAGFLLSRLLGAPAEAPAVIPPEVLAMETRSPAVAYLLGQAARRAGDDPVARGRFERAHAGAPSAPEATYWLGVTEAALGHKDTAELLFDTLIRAGASTGTLHALPAMYRRAMLAPLVPGPEGRAARMSEYEKLFHDRGQSAAPDELLFHGPLTALDCPPPAPSPSETLVPRFDAPRVLSTPPLRGDALTVAWPGGGRAHPALVATTAKGVVTVARVAAGHEKAEEKPTGTGVACLASADADADADPDLAVCARAFGFLPSDPVGGAPTSVANTAGVTSAVPGDLDHDGDLDWLLLGPARVPTFLRALGPTVGRLKVRHGPAPNAVALAPARGATGALALYADDDPRVDLLMWGPGLWLFRADRPGEFADVTAATGLGDGGPVGAAVAEDFDGDGRFDLALARADGVFRHRNLGGLRFGPAERVGPPTAGPPAAGPPAAGLIAGDFDADGRSDLLVTFPPRARADAELCQGGGPAGFVCRPLPGSAGLRSAVAVDFDLDGRLDVAGLQGTRLVWFRNALDAPFHLLRLDLAGRASNREGAGAVVEVLAGGLYLRRVSGPGPLSLGLGGARKADVLRVRWPTSAFQSVLDVPEGALDLDEPADLMGSCPYLYAWDGARFDFLGDIMGQAPIGIPVAPGVLVNADPSEPFLIPGARVAPRDGRLQFVLKEEFREITYVDRLALEAVDVPDGALLCPDGRLKAPPFPQETLYASAAPRPVRAARNGEGRDVSAEVSELDERAVGGEPVPGPPGPPGIVSTHTLELDLGPLNPGDRPVLYLDGWVFWAGANTNAALFQDDARPQHWPRLEVPDGKGGWRVAVPDVGLPAGTTTRCIPLVLGRIGAADALVDSRDPRVRIVTNLQAYWDRVRLAVDGGTLAVTRRTVPLVEAELAHRGLSTRIRSGGDGRGPALWDYARVTPPWEVRWGQVAGGHTPYGDARAPVAETDDALVTLDAGDELSLAFDVSALPAPAPGIRRDWMLASVGWDKDTNMHTAGNESVGPMPYGAMPGHPNLGLSPEPVGARARPPRALLPDLRLHALDAPRPPAAR